MSPATRLRLLAATAGALLLPALVAPVVPALAAEAPAGPSARIAALRADGPQLRFVLAVRGLTSGDALDAASLRVAAAGRTLSARAVTEDAAAVGDSSLLPRREAMLVVDTSGSMRGRRLAAAQAAALSYSAALPADVRLGLATFAARPVLRLAPTTDRSALASAVSRLTASGGTALYDGVVSAVGGFGTRGQAGAKGAGGATTERRMLVLSDGADTASRRALTGATTLLRSSGVRVDAIGLGRDTAQRSALRAIARAGAGRLLPVTGLDRLDLAFVRAAQTFRQRLVVVADLPDDLRGRDLSVKASVLAGGSRVTTSARVTVPAATSTGSDDAGSEDPAPAATSAVRTSRAPLLIAAGTFLVLLVAGLLALTPRSAPARRSRIEQLSAYRWTGPGDGSPQPVAPDAVDGQVATAALSVVDRLIGTGRSRSRIAVDLERAGMRMRPPEWVLLRICLVAGLVAVITVMTGSWLAGLVVGAALGWLGTRLFLAHKAARRAAAFADQLPDVLQLIASSLRSGFSLAQALEGVVREGEQPTTGEVTRALTESRLGVELETALDQAAERVSSQDLRWVVMAVRISREVGGNLADVLQTTVQTMRERAQLRRQVRALSAEGRLSAYILVGLPIVVAAWFLLVRPEYLRPLWTQTAGIVMLVVAVLGVVVGAMWMSRIVKVEA